MGFRFFKIINSPTKELVDLLKENIIGTPGLGMLYQHLEVQKKIDHIKDPFYVNLSKKDDLVGTCCFCSRDTLNSGQSFNSFYIRYFSFKEIFRTKRVVQKQSITGNSLLRKELISLLGGEGLGERGRNKFFHYAYVDPRNLRSALLCKEFGFDSVRKFSTIIFNRLNPKEDKRVFQVSSTEEIKEVKEKLINFYKDYTMFSFENLFNTMKYYVIKDHKGEIVAGVQAEPDSWKIHEMPGLSGKIILNTFSILPVLKKFINKRYHFLTLEGVYYSPDNEKYLETLIESLLATYKVNSAMVWVDTEASLYKSIRSLDLGIVDKLNKEVTADVICKFINFDNQEKKIFMGKPAYISGIDLT